MPKQQQVQRPSGGGWGLSKADKASKKRRPQGQHKVKEDEHEKLAGARLRLTERPPEDLDAIPRRVNSSCRKRLLTTVRRMYTFKFKDRRTSRCGCDPNIYGQRHGVPKSPLRNC